MDKTITVKYRTKKTYCNCCGQEIENAKTSDVREFNFDKEDCLTWLSQEGWEVEATCEDGFQDLIREFVYETISFFATSSDTKIIIEDSEFEKMKKFVLEEVVA